MITFIKGLAAAVIVLTGLSSPGHMSPPAHTSNKVVYLTPSVAAPDLDDASLRRNRLLVSVPPAPAAVAALPTSSEPEPPAVPDAPIGTSPAWQPSAPVPAATPPAIVIGSAQQALINADRVTAGLPPLTWSGCLANIAGQNAQRMVRQGAISHAGGAQADLACGLGPTAGENVGYWSGGISDGQLNTMFMNSAGHRANIMGNYRYVGTAWAVAPNGFAYIAVEFS